MEVPFCGKCSNTHCCLTCDNYDGSISVIPTHLSISCKVIKDKEVTLQLQSWPKIDGVLTKRCEQWQKSSNN